MKFIKYTIKNNETILPVKMPWSEVNEEIAQKEAYKGEYTIEDDGMPEPEQPDNPSGDESIVWDELDTAYQAGYNEGYTEGVNGAYDQ